MTVVDRCSPVACGPDAARSQVHPSAALSGGGALLIEAGIGVCLGKEAADSTCRDIGEVPDVPVLVALVSATGCQSPRAGQFESAQARKAKDQ